METLLIILSKKGIQKIIFGSSSNYFKKGGKDYSCSASFECPHMNNPTLLIQSSLKTKKHFIKTTSQFSRYFSGKLKTFSLPLDVQGTGFDQKVWKETQKIPYGKTWTYKEIAQKIGQPKASRAVGNALGRNPIPILIPCHRVIASNGTMGGYSSGLKIKKTLLSLEQKHM